MSKRSELKVISKVSDIPEGYIAMANLYTADGVRDLDLGKALSDAARDGKFAAVKLVRTTGDYRTGPVFCERAGAAAFVSARAARLASPDLQPQPEEEATEQFKVAADAVLESILRTVADEAKAIRESMVTLRDAVDELRAAVSAKGGE